MSVFNSVFYGGVKRVVGVCCTEATKYVAKSNEEFEPKSVSLPLADFLAY
ncbi:hypothetical protein VB735_31710 [Halotia wernerae UHCC 0503]|nr:hypothetical protein [Halotia wernerae UHCC 0503]